MNLIVGKPDDPIRVQPASLASLCAISVARSDFTEMKSDLNLSSQICSFGLNGVQINQTSEMKYNNVIQSLISSTGKTKLFLFFCRKSYAQA